MGVENPKNSHFPGLSTWEMRRWCDLWEVDDGHNVKTQKVRSI
jgi:hypothetical protein